MKKENMSPEEQSRRAKYNLDYQRAHKERRHEIQAEARARRREALLATRQEPTPEEKARKEQAKKEQQAARKHEYYLRNKEKFAEYDRKYQQANPEYRHEVMKRHYQKHRETELAKLRVYSQNLRLKVLAHYSGGVPQCACCGETHNEFLCLDHIEGNGNEHRRTINSKGGYSTYRWIIQNNFPDGYRTLCHNCNHSLGSYGYCPHGTVEFPAGELTKN